MSSKAPTKIEYEISTEKLFASNLSDGSHKHTLKDGIVVEAQVEEGNIVGYTAHDPSGTPLPVTRMRLTQASDAGPDYCMYCICRGDTCRCWTEPCIV